LTPDVSSTGFCSIERLAITRGVFYFSRRNQRAAERFPRFRFKSLRKAIQTRLFVGDSEIVLAE
jgi:hypothetical protein